MTWRSIRGRGCRASRVGPDAGFTLIEALVALVLTASVMVASVEAFAAGLRAQAIASQRLEAVALADARLSELAVLRVDSLDGLGTAQDGRFAPPFQNYRWRSAVSRFVHAPALRQVTVVVEWEQGSYLLHTTLYRPDPHAALLGQP
jgi:prepilin-type N-terminal cleavage/methylation domain-containing protein